MSNKRLRNLLSSDADGNLGKIIGRAQEMGALTLALARVLPPDERSSVIAANIRDDGELIVICRSSAWASRLRFETDTLLAAARAHGAEVEHCTIRVGRQDSR
jgi:hypothetical protein